MTFSYLSGARGVSTRYQYGSEKSYAWWQAGALLLCLVSVFAISMAYAVQAQVREINYYASSGPGSAPAALPVATTDEPTPDRSMEPEVEAWVAAQQGSDWGVYLRSLDTEVPLEVSVNTSKQFELASVYKLFLLQPLAKSLPASDWGTAKITTRSYGSCVTAMLSVSDNPCAEAIATKLTWRTIHQHTQTAGYSATLFNNNQYVAGTAADTGLFMERLYKSEGFDAATRGTALTALAKPKALEAIRRSCRDCLVYNKTGDYNGVKHDAAIIEKNGKSYVLVIFTKNATWPQLAEAARLVTHRL